MDMEIKQDINLNNYLQKIGTEILKKESYQKQYLGNMDSYKFESICRNLNNYIYDLTKVILKTNSDIWLLKWDTKNKGLYVFASESVLEIMVCVTNKCNLGCEYCHNNNDKHKINEWDIVRYINKVMKDVILANYPITYKEYVVTFYGGEPLLNFENILSIIDELNASHYIDIRFNIISNGILLNDKIIDIIVGKDITLYLQFDMNPFKIDNKYLTIEKKLLQYRNRYMYKQNIKIITYYDFYSDLEKMDKFYEKSNLPVVVIKENYLNEYTEKIPQSFIDRFLIQYKKLEDKYEMHKTQRKYCSSFLEHLFN